ncbi:MAG: hypothetical protein JWQ18_1914 [Conexibacter sp.]|nr:hypothetical protein [Conexibacter sp.]
MPILRRATVLSLLGVAALVAGASASAAEAPRPAIVPWIGNYAISVTGTQANSWTEHHEPTGPCDAKLDGSGKETDTLRAPPSVPIIATGIGPNVLTVVPAGGFEQTSLDLSRQGSVTEVDPTPSDADGCPEFGGGDGGTPPSPPGCGSRNGSINLYFTPGGMGLNVLADTTSFTTQAFPGEEPGSPFAGCPNAGTSLPTLIDVALGRPLATAWIPGSGPLIITMDGANTAVTATADVNGATTVQLQAELRGAAVATDVSASAQDIPISRGGVGNVTLSCPKKAKAACKGTLADYLTSADDDALATLPAPLPSGAQRLGKATSFRLRAGQRKKIRMALPKGTQTAAFSDLTLPIVLTESGQKGHKLSYVIARGHVHA